MKGKYRLAATTNKEEEHGRFDYLPTIENGKNV
jgi:hypothetical protein